MTEQELRDGIAYVTACLREIHTGAEERNLNPDEQTRWDDGKAYIADAQERLERLADIERFSKIPAAVSRPGGFNVNVNHAAEDVDVRTAAPFKVLERAKAILGDEDAAGHLTTAQRDQVDAFIRAGKVQTSGIAGSFDAQDLARRIVLTENPHYRSAFVKGLTSTSPAFTAEEARAVSEFRAMSIGTDASGGFGVPVLIDPSIILTAQESGNPFLNLARIENITTDEWKGVTSAGVSWSFDAEAVEVSDDSPTLAQPNVVTHMARGFIPYSVQVGQDYPNFAGEMSRLLMAGYDELLVSKFSTGSGTNEPFGILTALDANTNVEVVVTTDGSFGYQDVNAVWAALPQKYRRKAAWMMSVDVNNEIQAMGDEKLRAQTVNLAAGSVDQIKGKPVYESPYFADFTGTTGASNILVVGDWDNYLIARRLGMTVELVPHLFSTGNGRPTSQRGWLAFARIGADSVNDLGFRLLQNQ